MSPKRSLLNPEETSGLLALLGREAHGYEAFQERTVLLEKPRILTRPSLRDRFVVEALAGALRIRVERNASPRVFSYITGRGPHRAIRQLCRKLRSFPRGPVHVIRRDVRDYTDSIPVHENAPLWHQLRELFPEALLYSNLKGALRPEVISREHPHPHSNRAGIPMGLTLTPWIAVLYLGPVDRWAEIEFPEDLYLRFGDDLLFASSSCERTLRFREELPQRLSGLGLESKKKKELDLVIRSNGRALREEQALGFKGSPAVEYLGRRILWSGHIALAGEKRSLLLREARSRIRNVITSFGHTPEKTPLPELSRPCAEALFGALDDLWDGSWRSDPKASTLAREINHPGEWRSLRIDLLRETLRILSGNTSLFPLRKTGWKTLIHEWGWRPKGLRVRKAP